MALAAVAQAASAQAASLQATLAHAADDHAASDQAAASHVELYMRTHDGEMPAVGDVGRGDVKTPPLWHTAAKMPVQRWYADGSFRGPFPLMASSMELEKDRDAARYYPPPQVELSVPEQLEKLDELRQKGVISQAEFDAKKTQLLDRM